MKWAVTGTRTLLILLLLSALSLLPPWTIYLVQGYGFDSSFNILAWISGIITIGLSMLYLFCILYPYDDHEVRFFNKFSMNGKEIFISYLIGFALYLSLLLVDFNRPIEKFGFVILVMACPIQSITILSSLNRARNILGANGKTWILPALAITFQIFALVPLFFLLLPFL